MTPRKKYFTGRDALLWLVLFFGTIALVNGIMIWLALDSRPTLAEQDRAKDRVDSWKS